MQSENPFVYFCRRSSFQVWQAVASILVLVSMVVPAAQAAAGKSLTVDHNLISAPYPASYTKNKLARLAAKTTTPPVRKQIVKKTQPPTPRRPTLLELAVKPGSQKAAPVVQRVTTALETGPLLAAILGSDQGDESRTNVRLGYGRMVGDTSKNAGNRSGLLVEEPARWYVKTSVRF